MIEAPWPTDLRYSRSERTLTVVFSSGEVFALPAEYLRAFSPSAEVRGHGDQPRRFAPGKADVAIEAIEPVGNYAVRLRFDDGHDTGLYSWACLHELGRTFDEKWAAYEAALQDAGLSRRRT